MRQFLHLPGADLEQNLGGARSLGAGQFGPAGLGGGGGGGGVGGGVPPPEQSAEALEYF